MDPERWPPDSSTLTGGSVSGISSNTTSSSTTSVKDQGRNTNAATSAHGQGSNAHSCPFIKHTYQQIIDDAIETENRRQTVTLKINKIYDPNNSEY